MDSKREELERETLIQRLRDYWTEDETRYHIDHPICDEAADEIERLREAAQQLLDEVGFHLNSLDAYEGNPVPFNKRGAWRRAMQKAHATLQAAMPRAAKEQR